MNVRRWTRSGPVLRAHTLGPLVALSLALLATRAVSQDDDWKYDVTAFTIASSGAWGTGTEEHTSAAIAAAIVDCRKRAGNDPGDCGARQVYTRRGWILGYKCGEHVFAVSARSLQQAHAAAVTQEIDWRHVQKLEIPACTLVVAIGPEGKSVPTALVAREVLPVVGGRK